MNSMNSQNKITLARPSFDEQELDAVQRVLESGWVVQGPEVAAFENRLAALHQAKHCIAVSSGTAALHISYLALEINPGDAVFMPSFAWPSAANMAIQTGTRPVLVDVLPGTYNININDLQKQIDNCRKNHWGLPKVLIPVHQFGLAADLDSVMSVARENNLLIIEDAACALGAKYKGRPVGIFGRLAVFSFHPRKAITMGEGGAVITNDDRLAELCRMWRNHGQTISSGKRDFRFPGFNYRMTEIQAAIGQVQLDKFAAILQRRKEIAERYIQNLVPEDMFTSPESHPGHTWQTFMIVLKDQIDRSDIIRILHEDGIETGPGSLSAHCMDIYRKRFGYQPEDLPVSRQLHSQGLALPLHSHLSEADIDRVCRTLIEENKLIMTEVT